MILVVDDHADSRNALIYLLTRRGYEVTGVDSGSQALQFLRETEVALVILDYNMPEMDGLSVFQEMKKDPRLEKIPAVMFSALDGATRDKALEMGVSGYVVKGSLDWVNLESEITRLAGPGNPAKKIPPSPKPRAKEAG